MSWGGITMIKHSVWPTAAKAIAVLCLLAVMSAMASSGIGAVMDASAVKEPNPKESSSDIAVETLRCKYFNEKDFMSSVLNTNASAPVTPAPAQIAGGVVPHHLLAGEMIAGFFEMLSHCSPDTVVVIAPNHKRVGVNGIHTSTLSWGTSFGVLEADQSLTSMLIRDFNASQNTLLMEEEHSISSLVPYIKYYLPDSKIVPILLHGNYSTEDSVELGEWLAGFLAGQTSPYGSLSNCNDVSDAAGPDSHPRIAVIASVDFSHYLDKDTADKMDAETLAAIQSYDIHTISMMGNDNMDSPPSITALVSTMEKAGLSAPKVLAHDNSSCITGTGADYTTSYYTLLYCR